MSSSTLFKDTFEKRVPVWLRDRGNGAPSALNVGWRILWVWMAFLDFALDNLFRGINAAFPGLGTPTALAYIGRSRGLIRGEGESDSSFAARLVNWLDYWKQAGSMYIIGRVIHEYMATHPRVRVIQRPRPGQLALVGTFENGAYTLGTMSAWDWDSISHPWRSDPATLYFSDLWVVIYPSYTLRTDKWGDPGLVWGGDNLGIGHLVTVESYEAIKGLFRTWKSAGSKIRGVLFASRTGDYHPNGTGLQPDGTWGAYSSRGSGVRVASGRDTTYTTYWEP